MTQFIQKNFQFEIVAFFRHLKGNGKSAVISKLEYFLIELSCSYIALALAEGGGRRGGKL